MASSSEKRGWYSDLKCSTTNTVELAINGVRGGPIHQMFVEIWVAFSTVLQATGRNTTSAWSYACRNATGSSVPSLHSYPGLARDENPAEGPYRRTLTGRKVAFSDKLTQSERAYDVSKGFADTSLSRGEVEKLLGIRFQGSSEPALMWGGNWRTIKDAMHWEVDHPPAVVRRGIDWSTVYGHGGQPSIPSEEAMDKTRWVKVQEALQRAGFYLLKPNGQPYTVDGVPGDGTDTELKKWEQSLGLSQVGVIRSSVPTMDATSRDILLKDQGLAYGTVVRLGQP